MAEYTAGPSFGSSGRKNRFLLVVDSEANHLFYTAMLLQRFEYHVCTAKSVREALDMVSVAVPSLVIAAFGVGEAEDPALFTGLRQDPGTASVPVLALTASGDVIGVKRCIEAGAIECIPKPVQAEELYRAVQKAIEPTPRRDLRIHLRLPVTVNNAPLDSAAGGYATDLSAQGMYVLTNTPAPVNARLAVRFAHGDWTVRADAVVVYSNRSAEGAFREPGMGLRFVAITPEDQEHIRQYIRDHVTSGLGQR